VTTCDDYLRCQILPTILDWLFGSYAIRLAAFGWRRRTATAANTATTTDAAANTAATTDAAAAAATIASRIELVYRRM